MSVIFTNTPPDFQPVLSDGLFFTLSANTTNTFKFRYVYELYVNGQNVFVGKCTPNPFGLGIVDLQQILETWCQNNPISTWDTTEIYTHTTFPFSRPYLDEVISYQIKAGYEYASSPIAPVSGFTGIGNNIGNPEYSSDIYKTFRSTMGVNGRATQQDFDIDPFVMSGNPIGQYPTTSGLFLTNSPRVRRIDESEYYTLAFTNYWLGGTTGSTLSEPYYVEYNFYDDQGTLIRTDQYENIITNGGGPRQDCTQVYQALPILYPPSATTEYNTLYVGAGPANISGFPENTQYYTVQLFGKFTGTTSPIVPPPTPTPSPKPCNCTQYEIQALTRSVTLSYLSCDLSQSVFLVVDAGTIDSFCSCQDEINIISGFSYILTPLGECTPITPTPSATPVCTNCTEYTLQYTGENSNTAVSITNCVNLQTQQFIAENSVIYTICSCTFPLTDPEVIINVGGACNPNPVPSQTPTPTPPTPTPTPTPSSTPPPLPECKEYKFENLTAEPITIYYTDCDSMEQSPSVPGDSFIVDCALEGTITPNPDIQVTDLGPCIE
jgi:hypothetical protein